MAWTIQDLGAIGEFVGGIVIIATLIYLAIQTRQGAKWAIWRMYTEGVSQWTQFNTEMARDPELARLWDAIVLDSPDGLTREERNRCFSLWNAFIGMLDNAFQMNTTFKQRSAQKRWDRSLRWIGRNEFAKTLWNQTKNTATEEFQDYLDTIVARHEGN